MKSRLKGHILLFAIVIVLMAIGIPAAQAAIDIGWPAGQPNTPKNTDDIFIDFENGIEQIEIESTIPSLKFTTTAGLNWRYADIRTGNYNVYPYGTQAYEVNGNFGAWLGVTGNAGRIDFLGGGATYCSVLASTYSGLTIDAYNSENVLIANSGWADSNLNTRTFTRLTVEAPAGETISYVIIHDTGNYWIIDDLCTDADKAVIPVPGRSIGSHSDKFDMVFIPDNDYGSQADIETWLPTFLDHIDHQLDERLDGAAPVSGNLDKFNFYYTKMQGIASSKTLPADITLMAPFADAYVIFHTTEFGDSCRMTTPSIYGAEGPVGRSFIHESGHGIFRLADEYPSKSTYYFQPDPMPNIWATEALGRADATSEGWNPDDIWKFTESQGGWWKLGTTEYIMFDGSWFSNGWGEAASRRIQWFLDQFPDVSTTAEASSLAEKAIWLDLEISAGTFNLLDHSYVTDSAPNYLPEKRNFTANVFSTSGELLGEYGFNDPRRIINESDYDGPTWVDDVNFQLILPYFNNGGRIDLSESETGIVKLSVDISQYVTPSLAIMDVTPTVWSIECADTRSYTEIFNVAETGGIADLTNVEFNASDLVSYGAGASEAMAIKGLLVDTEANGEDLGESAGSIIPGSSISFTPNKFDVSAGSSVDVSAEMILPIGTPPGNYEGTIDITEGSGLTRTIFVTITIKDPVADFTAAQKYSNTPLTIQFTDQSIAASSWLWDLGDGRTSDEENPEHTYMGPGFYLVTLTVSNDFGDDTISKQVFVGADPIDPAGGNTGSGDRDYITDISNPGDNEIIEEVTQATQEQENSGPDEAVTAVPTTAVPTEVVTTEMVEDITEEETEAPTTTASPLIFAPALAIGAIPLLRRRK